MSGERSSTLNIRPLTPELWTAFENLFGKPGASNGCWCMYWRLGPGYRTCGREVNKAAMQGIVERGPPPGLLAFEGDVAKAWVQVTPREMLPWLDRARHVGRVDDLQVWSLSCFFVRRGSRGQSMTASLIEAALRFAKSSGAPALEAYPIDVKQPKATRNRFTGIASTFENAGFQVVLRRTLSRPIMRHYLETVPPDG
jgi:GNAT superfamily N-acetyltransferase